MKQSPERSRLNALFTYDADTGELRWRARPFAESDKGRWNIKYAGQIAGCINGRGYRVVTIDGIAFYAHRLIWKIMTGEDAVLLDHRNCIKDENRWSNLRKANSEENARNRRVARNKKSGLPKGIVFNHDTDEVKYQVSVKKGNYIGCYKTLSEARRAYMLYSRRIFGEFARHA